MDWDLEYLRNLSKKNTWFYLFSLEFNFDNFAKYGLKRKGEAGDPGEKQ